jgi:2-dehydro-3-deoxy-D-arabinonate dehydratase
MSVDWKSLVLRDGDKELPIDMPVRAPEVWAAGVSYRRSREAREYESGAINRAFYAQVYDAVRPELFLKDAGSRHSVGPGTAVFVRPDSTWSVPEPELALILDRDARIVAYTIGNDLSARDIEAENPLYLPQAKVYSRSCAIGPTALVATAGPTPAFDIAMRIFDRDGTCLFQGETSSGAMKRSFDELVSFLTRYNTIDDGTVLLTGTGIVPPDEFSLTEGHEVEIEISTIGVLRNPVRYPDGSGSIPVGR